MAKKKRRNKRNKGLSDFQIRLNRAQGLMAAQHFKGLDLEKVEWEYSKRRRELSGIYDSRDDEIIYGGHQVASSVFLDRKGDPYNYDILVQSDNTLDGKLDLGIFYSIDVAGRKGHVQHVFNRNRKEHDEKLELLTEEAFLLDGGQGMANFLDSLPGVANGNQSTAVGIVINGDLQPLFYA